MQIQFELSDQETRYRKAAGVDEAGRGPLAGEVVAAAVILDPDKPVPGLNDSKKLSASSRERCYEQIIEGATAFAISRASVQEIDELNILQASLLAMKRAVEALSVTPEFVYVDGSFCPRWSYPSTAVVKGDSRLQCVAAASVLAKITRDRDMLELEKTFPGYGFARHKGYPTRDHLLALSRLGPCAAHRRTFKPVAELL
jgi:ribonuclease HII